MAEDIKREKLPVLKNALGLDYIAPSPEDLYGTRNFTISPFPSNDPRNAKFNIEMGTGNRDTIARSPDIPVFTTPAAAAPPPTVSQSVAENTVKALTTGSNGANTLLEAGRRADAGKSLLGGDMSGIISNLLSMFARPEFQQAGFEGQGFGPTILGATKANAALQEQELATQAANLKALGNLEKAGPIWGDAKSFQVEKFDNLQRAIKSADTIQNMKKLLSEGFVTGGIPASVDLIRGLGNLVNISFDPSNLEEYKTQTNQLATDLVASGIFGKEVNKSEWELIFELIAKPGSTKGSQELLEKLNSLSVRINNNIESDSRVLRAMGVPIKPLLSPDQPLVSQRNIGGGN
jgi:hypothetical protein